MRTLCALTLCLPVACVDPSPYDATGSCTEDSVALDPADATLGFSANDALSLLQASAPERLVWEDLWLVEQEASLLLSAGAGARAPEQVTRTPDGVGSEAACRAGPELRMWVDLNVDIGGGLAVGSAEVPVEVTALDLGAVHLEDVEVPLTLSGSYAEAAAGAVQGEWGADTAIEQVWFAPQDLWSDGEVSVLADLRGPDLDAVTTLWRGSWVLP